MRNAIKLVCAALAVFCVSARGARAADMAVWSSPTAGTVNGVSFTASYTNSTNLALSTSYDFSTSDFNPAAGVNQQSVEYLNLSDITWTFASPVSGVGIYARYFRNATFSGPQNNLYPFSQAPTIQSGLAGATVSGNDLNVAGTSGYISGIIYFAGPLTTLTMSSGNVNPSNNGIQLYTIGVNISNVPEPSTYAMGVVAMCVLGYAGRRRKLRQVA